MTDREACADSVRPAQAATAAPSAEPAFLTVENLSVRYDRTDVLRGISLSVPRGTLVALLGSSGCGKTTLLRAVSGFVPVAGGRVLLNGRDITAVLPERRNTAMVFQSYALWPHMTVAQNIGYGLRLRRVPRAEIARKIADLLALLDLRGLEERNVTRLSGGQRQRVALGRALAIDPEMLLLDEPLSNLDARTRLSLRHEIRAIQTRLGITALHVTHDREEAMVMADRIVVMRDGGIEQEGPPERVYNQPATPFVASFMGADNIVRLSAQAAPSGVSLRLEPDGMPAGILPRDIIAHSGAFAAHFRMASARLLPQGQDAPEAGLHMPGQVLQASYPGGMWRHTVAVGDRRFLIDDTSGHPAGAAVGVFVPAALLHLFPA